MLCKQRGLLTFELQKLTCEHVYVASEPDMDLFEDYFGLGWMIRQKISGLMHDDCTPDFHVKQDEYDKEYRSVFGPFFPVETAFLPGSGALEYRTMIGRLIAQRLPNDLAKDRRLKGNQLRLHRLNRVPLHRFTRYLESRMERKSLDESYFDWLFAKHAKKALRKRTHEDSNDIGCNTRDDKLPVQYKMKSDELLAAHKKRGVGDLGAMRTDATAHVCGAIKDAWSGVFSHGSVDAEFVTAPDIDKLGEVFQDLLEPPKGRIVYKYFSDDSSLSALCKDGVVMINSDICKCDGSHGPRVFQACEQMLAQGLGHDHTTSKVIRRAFGYLGNRCVLRNKHRKEKVFYKFKSKRLYSGSVLTTIINNFANLNIALSLAWRVPDPTLLTKEEFAEQCILAAEDVGYIIRLDICKEPEQLQFLKHSPSVVDGFVTAWMNLGVYMRGFGTFRGDLPGKKSVPIVCRAKAFVSEVVKGRKFWGNHDFNTSFGHLISSSSKTNTVIARHLSDQATKSVGRDVGRFIPLESLAVRYEIKVDELRELISYIKQCNVFTAVSLPVVQKIYTKDYG